MLASLIDGAVEVSGSDKPEVKESRILGFTNGDHRVLVTKPKIAGFGMNWQHCRNMIFVGLSDSWEQYYQAIRRCWRFGQTEQVNVFVVTADIEGMVVENIKRKDGQSERMMDEMAKIASSFFTDFSAATKNMAAYQPKKTAPLPRFI
jgi:SNF2 family DNA or RNA helicase